MFKKNLRHKGIKTKTAHAGINAMTPENKSTGNKKVLSLSNFKWKKHLRGLVQLPTAA